jgi:hypothetical protein
VNLITSSLLIDTPLSDTLAIRYVTAFSKCDLKLYNLIEVEQELKDSYFIYMKQLGLMDYVEQYITPEERVSGIRIDVDFNYTNTIKTNSIDFGNTSRIIEQLKIFTNK